MGRLGEEIEELKVRARDVAMALNGPSFPHSEVQIGAGLGRDPKVQLVVASG